MTELLLIGDYAYSSWSLRGWLLFEHFGLPVGTRIVDFHAGSVAAQMAEYPPARTVPTALMADGAVVSETLAIAEELASRHPGAGHWPADPAARATARTLAAEMHSGFGALREHCPMNLRASYAGFPDRTDVSADLRRLEVIWDDARSRFGGDGPWLCGAYSAADAFFAPVAARIAGYNLPVSDTARDYVNAHLADLPFRRWRAMGLVAGATLERYRRDYPQTDWPGPAPLAATPTARTDSENAACPYSGRPVTHFLETQGRVFGFCNPFCRDKTVADPLAFPAFAALVNPR